MATENEMVELVSQDTGDYWKSTTNGAGSTTTLVDKALINEDNDDFVTDRAQIHMLAGDAADETAGILSKSGDTLTVKTSDDFTTGTDSGNAYEVHRLFTRKEKVDAITRALDLVFPQLFTIKQEDVTVVAAQYQYTLTNFTFRTQPSRVAIQSDYDVEKDIRIFNWEIMPENGKLRFTVLPSAGRIFTVSGIIPPTLALITDSRHKQILSSMAALELYDQAVVNSPSDQVSRWERASQKMEITHKKRVAKFGPTAPPWTLRTDVHEKVVLSSSRRP